MPAQSHDRRQAERLARAFAADVVRQQEETRALALALGATIRDSRIVGQHGRRSLEQLAADSGFSDAGREELAPVLSFGGRAYR